MRLPRPASYAASALAPVLLACLLAAGCAGQDSPGGTSARSSSGASVALSAHTTAHTTATRSPVRKGEPKVTKLLVVVEENHSLAQMKKGMPYTFGLAKEYGYADHYSAITHPSLPNYVAITGGRTYGITDDLDPSAHPLQGRSVFGQALAHDRTAALYAQSMPSRCATTNSGAYAVRHNPWAYFAGERSQCRTHEAAMSRFAKDVRAGDLPRVGMVVPDVDHDAHDGTLGTADAWFKSLMTKVLAGKDWKSGHLAVVLTADEDDRSSGNRVLTVVIHPSQQGHVVTEPLTHYSLTRLYDEVAQLPLLHQARTAPSMATAFGLPVR